MMLVHLPGGRPRGESPTSDSETEGDDGALGGGDGAGRAGLGGGGGEIMVEGAWWNPSLAGKRGLFGGLLELRREILDSSGRNGVMGDAEVRAQYRVWYEGKRMPRLGPALQDEVD